MVVFHRATVTVMVILPRIIGTMVHLTARVGHFAAIGFRAAIHGENAGIQASENAENQQRCEQEPH